MILPFMFHIFIYVSLKKNISYPTERDYIILIAFECIYVHVVKFEFNTFDV